MTSFSERFGLEAKRTVVQIDSMDDALRAGLWNAVTSNPFLLRSGASLSAQFAAVSLQKRLSRAIWSDFFKRAHDTMPTAWEDQYADYREYFFNAAWNKVYDFLEFIGAHYVATTSERGEFFKECNHILEREVSAYRFVNGSIAQLTAPAEIEAIEAASNLPSPLGAVSAQLNSAFLHLTNRETPDYRNSIKESIGAVESMCSIIAGQEKADLNTALKTLEKKLDLHGALRRGFDSLFGYTSDSDGIRHGLMLDKSELTFDDAKFMLVTCSAFVNYLKALCVKAGIAL